MLVNISTTALDAWPLRTTVRTYSYAYVQSLVSALHTHGRSVASGGQGDLIVELINELGRAVKVEMPTTTNPADWVTLQNTWTQLRLGSRDE